MNGNGLLIPLNVRARKRKLWFYVEYLIKISRGRKVVRIVSIAFIHCWRGSCFSLNLSLGRIKSIPLGTQHLYNVGPTNTHTHTNHPVRFMYQANNHVAISCM